MASNSENNIPDSLHNEEHAAKKSILIIEDEDGVRAVLEELLSMEGYKAIAVSNGFEGLSRFKETQFDLVFTDVRMPGMSGREVSKSIREISPNTPIIVITGWDPVTVKREFNDIEANVILKKPFDVDEVLDLVSKLI